jgi:hypothetical protein
MDPVPEKTQGFTGIVLDYTTHQPIADALVSLYIDSISPGGTHFGTLDSGLVLQGVVANTNFDYLNNYCPYKYTAFSDLNGHYSFHESYDNSNMDYRVAAAKTGYLSTYCPVDIRNIINHQSFTDTIYLEVPSILKTIFHHTQPINTGNDTLLLKCEYFNSASIGGFPYEAYVSAGHKYVFSANGICVFSDSVSFKTTDLVAIEWEIYNNGLKVNGETNPDNLIEFGTKQIDIIY